MRAMSKDVIHRISEQAIGLFKSGIAQDAIVNTRGEIETPIRMVGPDEDTVSWFVGTTVEDKLVGFMQFGTELRLMRYSTFQRRESSMDGCPHAKVWLDSSNVLSRAKTIDAPGDELMEPFLSYDRHPTCVAWAVRAKDKDGKVRIIYVAGNYVYESLEDSADE